ncbi:MAG: antitoxin [Actinomycetota bacterium]
MTRTTVDIDSSVLKRLRSLAKQRRTSLGTLISELLAQALASKRSPKSTEFRWESSAMNARVDLEDKNAVLDALDRK